MHGRGIALFVIDERIAIFEKYFRTPEGKRKPGPNRASAGIGLAISAELRLLGANVVIANRKQDKLDAGQASQPLRIAGDQFVCPGSG